MQKPNADAPTTEWRDWCFAEAHRLLAAARDAKAAQENELAIAGLHAAMAAVYMVCARDWDDVVTVEELTAALRRTQIAQEVLQ